MLSCWGGQAGFAQLTPTYTIKFDPGGAFSGEFRFAAEFKITSHKTVYTSASYFQHEQTIDDPPLEAKSASGVRQAWQDFTDFNYNKFFFTSASYFYRDFEADRERLQGPILRAGIRQYFLTDFAPKGPYFYLGIHYGFIYAEAFDQNNQPVEQVYLHKPGLSGSLGYQWLFGHKKNFALDFFGGLEYSYLVEQETGPGQYEWRNLPDFIFYAGVGLGFAFRQKHRHW